MQQNKKDIVVFGGVFASSFLLTNLCLAALCTLLFAGWKTANDRGFVERYPKIAVFAFGFSKSAKKSMLILILFICFCNQIAVVIYSVSAVLYYSENKNILFSKYNITMEPDIKKEENESKTTPVDYIKSWFNFSGKPIFFKNIENANINNADYLIISKIGEIKGYQYEKKEPIYLGEKISLPEGYQSAIIADLLEDEIDNMGVDYTHENELIININ